MTNPQTNKALLPCPFCGGDAVSRVPEPGYGLPFVACTRCTHCYGPAKLTEAEAITAWNTRTDRNGVIEEAARRDAVCKVIEAFGRVRIDAFTGLALGSDVERLADRILTALRTDREAILREALEPFARIWDEGVAQRGQEYTGLKTCTDYFHRASEAYHAALNPEQAS